MKTVVAYTTEEGGPWVDLDKPMVVDTWLFEQANLSFFDKNGEWKKMHSVRFIDGTEWDCVNGFRP